MANIERVPGFILMLDRDFPEFRQKIYNYLKNTLSSVLTSKDLDVIVMLIAEIFGDLYLRAKRLPWEIDVDKCPDEHLKALSSLIGYKWNDTFTPDEQRESIKLFCLIRSWRGTNFGLSNLIRSFGQSAKSYYSSADLRDVKIVEYGSGGADTIEPYMYPGDIKIEIPELSSVLRDSIDDTKLAGTRLIFLYYIFLDTFYLKYLYCFYFNVDYWVNLLPFGYNSRIDEYSEEGLDQVMNDILDEQLTHISNRGEMIAGCEITITTV